MKKAIIFLFFLTLTFGSHAQVEGRSTRLETNQATPNTGSSLGFGIATSSASSNYSNIRSYGGDGLSGETVGSPFLYEDFLIGSIWQGEKMLSTNVGIRYNVMNDIFEGKLDLSSDDSTAKVITKSEDYQVKIGNKLFVPLTKDGVLSYFEVLYAGKNHTLLKQHKKKFTPEIQATTSLTRTVPATFKSKEFLFLMNGEGNMTEIPTSKKKALKVFTGQESEVKKIAKEKRLNITKEKDLIRLLKLLN